MAKRIPLRSWRVTEATPSGCHVWFDPLRESLRLFELDPPTESGVAKALERGDQLDQSAPDQVNLVLDPEDDLPF